MSVQHALRATAEELVRSRISGHRKGMPDAPTYLHSFRVAESLERHGYDSETCLAGLLHDVVEDGGVQLEELEAMGFSARIVELVRLCSHDMGISHKDSRWLLMVAGLVRATDAEAWAIKLVDVLDNLGDAHAMSPDRAAWMRQVKAPLLLRLSEPIIGTSALWRVLREAVGTAYSFA